MLSFGSDRPGRPGARPEGDGGAYVIDATSGVVYRVDLVTRAKREIAVTGRSRQRRLIVGHPRLLAVGGPRRPDPGQRQLALALASGREAAARATARWCKVNVDDSGTWGSGVRAIGTFVTAPDLGQYNSLHRGAVSGPGPQVPAASDGSGYYAKAKPDYLSASGPGRLAVDDMYIDGNLYLVDNGVAQRFDSASRSGTGPRTRRPTRVIRPEQAVLHGHRGRQPGVRPGQPLRLRRPWASGSSRSPRATASTSRSTWSRPARPSSRPSRGMFIRTDPNDRRHGPVLDRERQAS